MILQALNRYYERKAASGDGEIARPGFAPVKIPVVLELNAAGELMQAVYDDDKNAKPAVVPALKRTSGIKANLLWDKAEYALGVGSDEQMANARRAARIAECHVAFKQKVEALPEPAASDAGVIAVRKFLAAPALERLQNSPAWEAVQSGANVGFRLLGDAYLVCQREAVINAISAAAPQGRTGICLISGAEAPIARVHAAIKGVWGAQTSGANIVSFNQAAFRSFNKSQGDNSPVGADASFAYTTALNHLLAKGSKQRIQVGDASTVFWAEEKAALEDEFGGIFGASPREMKDDPDAYTNKVAAVFNSIHRGRYQGDDGNTRFYVLGLAPNASRIAIRFWHAATVAEIAARIVRHFNLLAMANPPPGQEYLPLLRLLTAVAVQGKIDNIPPTLAGEVMRSILAGLPYPHTLLAAAVLRCKAEMMVNYPRAAIIKACINSASSEDLKMSLDLDNTGAAYRLGRLFAVLEKIQEESHPGINATIRDRYYGAACGNPANVFPTLLRLKNHHIGKLESVGRGVNFEKMLGEIIGGIAGEFPRSLNLHDQGRFAVGYYHQRQALFTRGEKGDAADAQADESVAAQSAQQSIHPTGE